MKDKSFVSIFTGIYKYILILLTLIMFVIVGANVFARFVLNSSLGWGDELARFIFIWISFLGAVFAYTTDDHVGLNFLVAKIESARVQNIVSIISDLFILLVVGFITYYGYIVAVSATNVSPALYIPMSLIYAVVPVSGLMMVVINLMKTKKHIELYIKDEKEKSKVMEDIGGVE